MTLWKPVKGYEGIYEVSNDGRVKSLARLKECGHPGAKQMTKERLLKIKADRMGYPRVKLSKNGVAKLIPLHRVVALSFVENPHNKPEVNHIDGDKTNNLPDNLEWATRSENLKHAFDKKLKCAIKGEENNKSKLKAEQVLKIRLLRNEGVKLVDIADKFGVTAANVSEIVNFKTWKDVY